MKKMILSFLKIFQSNREFFYGPFYGTDNRWILLLKNCIQPKRYFEKLLYGQKKWFPNVLGKPFHVEPSDSTVRQCVRELKENGYTVYPVIFPEIADHLLQVYQNQIGSLKASNRYSDILLNQVDQKIIDFIANDSFLQILGNVYGMQPYLRVTGSIKVTHPDYNSPSTQELAKQDLSDAEGFNVRWHYDTVNMLQIHFLLTDTTESGTHMVTAKGSHLVDRTFLRTEDFNYSDEYVKANYEVVPFTGKKGTVFIWNSEMIHKAQLVKGSCRIMLQMLYSPGNAVLTKTNQDPKLRINADEMALRHLSPIARESIRFVVNS